jgi:hypothetical protein
MQLISSHIAYLLTRHECVIVPGLGAFVVSDPEESKSKKEGLLCPPAKFLGFNPDIRHNDGLLANAIARTQRIPYKDACLQITRYVGLITDQMEKRIPSQLPWIGRLELSPEHKYLFTPAYHLSCNAHIFGMNNFYLPTIHELTIEEQPLPHPTPIRQQKPTPPSLLRRSLSIAAAILLLLMVAIPISDHSHSPSQTANLLPLPTAPSPTPPEVAPPIEATPYYIIVASLPTQAAAQTQIQRFQTSDLPPLRIVSDGNKHRIYVASFAHKTEATAFLTHFRTQHPQHRNAWLLIQRH